MSEKILTIIIPSYNMEMYLDRCLSSLIVDDDMMSLFEALIVNDGSKDKTSEIGHGYETRFPGTYRVIDKENGHYGSCINRGLEEAKGTFIKVLDADDSFDTAVFKLYLRYLQQTDVLDGADAILSGYTSIDVSSQTTKKCRYSLYSSPVSPNEITSSDRLEWFLHGLTYRTTLLTANQYRQTEGISYTDNEWAFIPMFFVKRVFKFDGQLYLYSVGREDQSISASIHTKDLWMETNVAKSLITFYNKNINPAHPNKDFLDERLLIILTHLYQLYLVTYYRPNLDLEPLQDLDTHLKANSPQLYNETGLYATRIAGIKFHPIRNWRENKKCYNALQRALYALAEKITTIKS